MIKELMEEEKYLCKPQTIFYLFWGFNTHWEVRKMVVRVIIATLVGLGLGHLISTFVQLVRSDDEDGRI